MKCTQVYIRMCVTQTQVVKMVVEIWQVDLGSTDVFLIGFYACYAIFTGRNEVCVELAVLSLKPWHFLGFVVHHTYRGPAP